MTRLIKQINFPSDLRKFKKDKLKQELLKIAESELTYLGEQGATNMIPKNEQFITDNGQEGLKTFGKTNFIFKDNLVVDAEFVILGFSAKNLVQQLILVWDSQNDYTVKISDRILSSVELVKLNQEKKVRLLRITMQSDNYFFPRISLGPQRATISFMLLNEDNKYKQIKDNITFVLDLCYI